MRGEASGAVFRLATQGDIHARYSHLARTSMSDRAEAVAIRAQLGRLRGAARELTRGSADDPEVRDLSSLMALAGRNRVGICYCCDGQAKETRHHWRHCCSASRSAFMMVEAAMSESLALSGDDFWFHTEERVTYCDTVEDRASSWRQDMAFRSAGEGLVAMFTQHNTKPAAVIPGQRTGCGACGHCESKLVTRRWRSACTLSRC